MALDNAEILEIYRKMVTIRVFVRRAAQESQLGNIPTPMQAHQGEEASAVGICAVLRKEDRITSTHRSLGHSIAKGMDIRGMMAELFGRSNGVCNGKGGGMHLADFERGMMGANGIVGGGLPIATGAALAAQMDGGDNVAVAFFGDGASNEGTFHSSLNLASIWKLPVIYVCENNGWAIAVPASYALSVEDVSVRSVSYGIPGITIDGTDVLAVREAMEQAVERARNGGGPTLLECKTYRTYVEDELSAEESVSSTDLPVSDPIRKLRQKILELGLASSNELLRIEKEIASSVNDSVDFAKSGDLPRPEDALTQVFAP